MIKQLTDKNLLDNLSCSDIYEGKIKTLYRAYGLDYKHCCFYTQESNTRMGKNALLISQLDRDFVIKFNQNGHEYLNFDAQELAEFLKLNRALGIFLPPVVLSKLEPFIVGEYLYNNLMEYDSSFDCDYTISRMLDDNPKLDDMFGILKHEFNITYDLWLTDASHRKRHGISSFYLYDGSSAATVLYDMDGVVFITQVATKKEARSRGLATNMLREIARLEQYRSKRVLLVCREKMLSFYEKVGFKKIDSAAQIYKLNF